ncbi:hypothetical protein Leryth_017990 [Lithospermum erythrorhizon]|nr:hypothetical protein Leryth_017990 [Lithospermum erythrorhizon]
MKQILSKSILYFVVFVLFLAGSLVFMGRIDYRSRFFANWQPCLRGGGGGGQLPALKVYMYDLPRRFNVGMLTHHGSNDDLPVTIKNLPPWPARSGLNKQHSVEYWMMASLLYYSESRIGGGGVSGQEVVRVSDPESADVFFVPFFSSLSFNVHGKDMRDPDTEFDKQLQVDIIKILSESTYWKRSSGRDHVIPVHHPNSFRFMRDGVNASILIVADFGRPTHIQSNLTKDVVAPYVHVVNSFLNDESSDPYESRPNLLFFRGRTDRKDEGKVRGALARVLNNTKGVIYDVGRASDEGIQESVKGMRSSKFCLNPAGDTPSSCRLFDAIVSHCVPVIVSDKIELPYEDELDYSEFSIFFSDEEASKPNYMVDKLQGISKEKWLAMWRQLKTIAPHFEYQYPPKNKDAVNMIWRQVRHKLPAAKLAQHRSRRLKVPDWWR